MAALALGGRAPIALAVAGGVCAVGGVAGGVTHHLNQSSEVPAEEKQLPVKPAMPQQSAAEHSKPQILSGNGGGSLGG